MACRRWLQRQSSIANWRKISKIKKFLQTFAYLNNEGINTVHKKKGGTFLPRKIRKLSLAILFIIILGIGGKVYMDKREVQRQKDLLAVEKQSVKVLKNTFADIKEVKIEKSARNEMTGSYRIVILMTNKQDQSIYFSYSFWKESRTTKTLSAARRTRTFLSSKNQTNNYGEIIL